MINPEGEPVGFCTLKGTVVAGGFHTYGQNQMWRMEPGWESTFDTPGADQVCRMKEILSRLNWWEMVPDQSVFAAGVGSERTLNTAMLSIRDDRVLAYLSSQCTVFIHLDKIATRALKATWINPVSGERKDTGTHLTGKINGQVFLTARTQYSSTPGHWEDALLLLEAVR